MIISELIEKLSKMPQDAEVWQHLAGDDYHCFEGGLFPTNGDEFEFNETNNRLEIWT